MIAVITLVIVIMSKDDSNLDKVSTQLEQREKLENKTLDDMYDIFIKKRKEAAERRLDANALPMIAFIEGKWKLTAHESIFNSDEALGMALVAAIKATKDPVEVYKIKSNFTYTDEEGSQNFFYGMALGADDTIPTRLDRSKRGIELGRALSYAIRVHGEFQQNNRNLGLSALKKDQFFFGNNFGEVDPKRNQKVAFGLRTIFRSYFSDSKIGDAYYEVLSKLLHSAALSNHTDEQYEHAIELYIIPFDEFIARFNRPVSIQTNRNKNKVTMRKPNKPVRSPLFLKSESRLLSEILTPVWENLDTFKKGWLKFVKDWGFSAVAEKISEIMNLRWTILESFSRVTTLRLNSIRGSSRDAINTKKSDITIEMVNRFLYSRKHLVDSFVGELLSIIPKKSLKTVISEGLLKGKTVPQTEEECYLILAARAFDVYQKLGFEQLGDAPKKVVFPEEKEIAHIFNFVRDNCSRIQQFKLYRAKLWSKRSNQSLMTLVKMMVSMKNNLLHFFTEMNSCDINVVDEVFNLVKSVYPITNKVSIRDFMAMTNDAISTIEQLEKVAFVDNDTLRINVMRAVDFKP